jgi:hypothetical protein
LAIKICLGGGLHSKTDHIKLFFFFLYNESRLNNIYIYIYIYIYILVSCISPQETVGA